MNRPDDPKTIYPARTTINLCHAQFHCALFLPERFVRQANTKGRTAANGGGNPDMRATEVLGRDEALKKLTHAERQAYFAYQYTESKAGRPLEDREAYGRIMDESVPADQGDLGDLEDFEPPKFDTWCRLLRRARRKLGEQKYSCRRGCEKGPSIAPGEQVDKPRAWRCRLTTGSINPVVQTGPNRSDRTKPDETGLLWKIRLNAPLLRNRLAGKGLWASLSAVAAVRFVVLDRP